MSVGTDSGFSVYDISKASDFKKKHKGVISGGVKLIQYIGGADISITKGREFLILVGSGENKSYPDHKIVFWDCNSNKAFSEVNCSQDIRSLNYSDINFIAGFESEVRGYKLVNLKVFA